MTGYRVQRAQNGRQAGCPLGGTPGAGKPPSTACPPFCRGCDGVEGGMEGSPRSRRPGTPAVGGADRAVWNPVGGRTTSNSFKFPRLQWVGPMSAYGGFSGRSAGPLRMSAYSQKATFDHSRRPWHWSMTIYQDRGQGRQPWPLRDIQNGGGRLSSRSVTGNPAPDLQTVTTSLHNGLNEGDRVH